MGSFVKSQSMFPEVQGHFLNIEVAPYKQIQTNPQPGYDLVLLGFNGDQLERQKRVGCLLNGNTEKLIISMNPHRLCC